MKISYENITNYSDQLALYSSKIEEKFMSVLSDGEIVCKHEWTGPASQLYLKRIKALKKGFDDIQKQLSSACNYLDSVVSTYEQLDKELQESINSWDFDNKWK